MSALKRVFSLQLSAFSLLFILFIANLFISAPPALAAASQDFKTLDSTNYNDSVGTDRFYRNQLVTLYHLFYGTDPFGNPVYSEKVAITTENGQTKVASVPGLSSGDTSNGAIGMLGNTIASLYTPPTSSTEYLAHLGDNLGITPKTTYAQEVTGSGADVLSPVMKLWQVVRNIAYTAFILVFMAAGLMIMFRQRLNPQTVIGIQQALPGLIIGLVLITFSYFIAALIVDLSFVGTRLVAEIFISTNEPNLYGTDKSGKENIDALNKTYKESSAFHMYTKAGSENFLANTSNIFQQVWGSVGPKPDPNQLNNFLKNLAGGITTALGPIGAIVCLSGSDWCNSPVAGTLASGVTGLATLLIPTILAIAFMIQFIRLIIALLMSYIQILIMVIAGPIFILISAIPGRGGVLSYWFKGLLANALVFPAVFAGFLFAGLLLDYNFSGQASMPLFGGLKPDITKSLLAFGVLLGLPSIPEMVRNAFGVKGPQGFTQAAIGGFMGGFNTGKAATVGGYNQAMEKTGIRNIQQGIREKEIDTAKNAVGPGQTGLRWNVAKKLNNPLG